jgi:hypothetical protein
MERVARALKRAAQRGRQPEQIRGQAERARRMAEKLSEKMTPEQREELRRLAGEMGAVDGDDPGSELARPRMVSRRDALASPSTEPVDVRRSAPDRPAERVIAEWYSDRPIERAGSGAAPAPAVALREAAASAERAVEKQEVPARYSDMVRRVFKRYSDQAPKP